MKRTFKFKNQEELSAWLIHCSYRWTWDYAIESDLTINAQWI